MKYPWLSQQFQAQALFPAWVMLRPSLPNFSKFTILFVPQNWELLTLQRSYASDQQVLLRVQHHQAQREVQHEGPMEQM